MTRCARSWLQAQVLDLGPYKAHLTFGRPMVGTQPSKGNAQPIVAELAARRGRPSGSASGFVSAMIDTKESGK